MRAVTACFFGDGATDEGEFHESMNLAALWRLPVLFICENNLYAMGTALARHASVTDLCVKPRGYGISAEDVDGMDVLAVEAAARHAVEEVRRTRAPRFLECRTYRFRAHSMYDAELYRSKEEIARWSGEHDPIESLRGSAVSLHSSSSSNAPRLRISPSARLRARELGVNPEGVRGTGPGGAITRADIESATQRPSGTSVGVASADAAQRMRQAIAAAMARSNREIPAILDADTLSLDAIMQRLGDLVERSRRGQLRSSELSAGTITLTSLGERGVEAVFGVIYPPQVALIGLGSVCTRPWVIADRVVPRRLLHASLAADHRASDGHRGGLFLAALERLLKEHEKL